MRELIKEADPDVVEEWKRRGTPVSSHDGIICTGEPCKALIRAAVELNLSLVLARACRKRVAP